MDHPAADAVVVASHLAQTPARERMLAAVLEVIGADGIPAVTNRRIAAEAEVSLGSVTYHFATQPDMLRAALLRFVERLTARLTVETARYEGLVPDLSEAATLVSEVAASLAFTSEQVASFELYLQAGRDATLRGAAAECFAAYDALTVTVLTALGVPDAARLAPAIVGMITGLQLRRLATGEPGQGVGEALALLVAGTAQP